MKTTFSTIVIGFVAGLFGAFVYQKYFIDINFDRGGIVRAEEVAAGPLQFVSRGNNAPETLEKTRSAAIPTIDFVKASKASRPCVVYIKTVSRTQIASSWMDYFFGNQVGQTISSGSGVIYSPDGYIVTNNHVIDEADKIQVNIGKRSYNAKVVGADPSTDLAVLKIDADNLPSIEVASSQSLEVGDWVLAVGNPFNLNSTVTAGIVSAKGRDLNIVKSAFPIESFIQTDAAINPGNSGGALVNLDGELVGINTAILSKTGSYAGYGFAVPSDIVKKVVDDIIEYGMVQKAFFGGDVLDIDREIAEKLELNNYHGVVLGYKQEGGAAEKAGLQRGDVILKINNEPIETRSEFEELISYHSPGDELSISYKRNNEMLNTSLVLTNKEGTTELLKREIIHSKTLGADFERVSKVERNMLNLRHGVRILEVRGGLIQQMGLPEGFIIDYINKIPIETPEELIEILGKIRGRVYVEGVNKKGQRQLYRYYF